MLKGGMKAAVNPSDRAKELSKFLPKDAQGRVTAGVDSKISKALVSKFVKK